MPTAAFTTLGCKVNQYETQRILESFEEVGFDVVPFDTIADVYVINSCSVTSTAEGKSRYTIRRANRLNPDAKVVVTGCAAQMSINRGEVMEGADLVVANSEKLDTLKHLLRQVPAMVPTTPTTKDPVASSHRTRATLKVQDGCNVLCSYCSIPFTRPVMTSRPYHEVLDEAGRMGELGYKEIILTGVLIGAYGPETGSEGPRFEDLIEMLVDVEGIERIRISSIEMRQVTPRLIAMLGRTKVVPHLHIPLQSGDTQVLKDMNRPYTQEDYLALCDRLYESVPGISITTDVMVGFPTETEDRFQSTKHVFEQARYLKAHVFRFSPRYGTPADQWGDPIPDPVKQHRSLELNEIARGTAEAHRQSFLGRTMKVLIEGKLTKDGLLEGLTENYLDVRFPGPSTLRRSIAWVRLEELREGSLYGELVSSPGLR